MMWIVPERQTIIDQTADRIEAPALKRCRTDVL